MKRYLEPQVKSDLEQKMVFLGGPRQVGKTTLAKSLLPKSQPAKSGVARPQLGYLNYDIPLDREVILTRKLPDVELLIFDEIHKYRKWRNYLKGVYDQFHPEKRILVTGSARLDLYRFGGDSLQGRYYYLRLHPLSFAEIGGKTQSDLEQLFKLGGFPEPFLGGSEARARRWSVEYRNRLVREDISVLESIRDLGSLENLILALPERVGSPLSVNSLREDLELNHQTVSRWLDILERTYAIFRVMPFGSPRIRAIKKDRKHYHYDWSLVPETGPRFENMIGSHLLKWTHHIFETEGRELELRYFRDVDAREVDFVIVERKKPILFVECRASAGDISPSLTYIKTKFPETEAIQLHYKNGREFIDKSGIQSLNAASFLSRLV